MNIWDEIKEILADCVDKIDYIKQAPENSDSSLFIVEIEYDLALINDYLKDMKKNV